MGSKEILGKGITNLEFDGTRLGLLGLPIVNQCGIGIVGVDTLVSWQGDRGVEITQDVTIKHIQNARLTGSLEITNGHREKTIFDKGEIVSQESTFRPIDPRQARMDI